MRTVAPHRFSLSGNKHPMNKPSRLLALVLPAFLLAAPEPSRAATQIVNGIKWSYSISDGKASVDGIPEDTSGDVVIPATLGGKPVTVIGEHAFSDRSGLTSITIPIGLDYIGKGVFSGCSGLTSVVIPDGVAYIDDNAFSGCSGLKSITIPASVTSIGQGAFSGCSGLTSITIPASVTSIGDSAFAGCSGLTSIAIPDGVTSVGISAFSGCSGLKSITIPDRVGEIGEFAFADCVNLTKLTLPQGLESISGGCFYNCEKLSTVSIPVGVKTIASAEQLDEGDEGWGRGAFEGCAGLTSITIPDGVTQIDENAFSGCSSLTSVSIPSSLSWIGENAFSRCAIQEVRISDLKAWFGIGRSFRLHSSSGWNDFESWTYCESKPPFSDPHRLLLNGKEITALVVPKEVKKISAGAFAGCSGLKSVAIPAGVTSIGDCAFQGCSGLTAVEIPKSVKTIGEAAFAGCAALSSATIRGNVELAVDSFPKTIKRLTFTGKAPVTLRSEYSCDYDDDDPAAVHSSASSGYNLNVFKGKLKSYWKNCTVYVAAGSKGWGVKIPGTWRGLPIKYLTHKVKFAANGGKGKMATQTMTYGKAAKISANKFTRKGWVFIGWSTKKTGAVVYKNSQKVKNLRSDGKTVTLYAQWAKQNYKVKFYANGGTGKMAAQKMVYGKAAQLSANTFKRAGHVFKGWAKTKTGAVVYKNKKKVKNLVKDGKTVKLYAVWKKK